MNMISVISKTYCSSSQTLLVIRRRPHVINGGGFVVTDCSQKVVFRVDGCGVLGTKGELMVRDAHGDGVLLIRRKGGIVQALCMHKKWNGYAYDYEGSQNQVFCLKEPNFSCLAGNNNITIRMSTTQNTGGSSSKSFEIKGDFVGRDCSIIDHIGNNIVAEIGVKKEVEELMMTGSKDLFHVLVKPGVDQAFVIGVIATLDYIYGESTKC